MLSLLTYAELNYDSDEGDSEEEEDNGEEDDGVFRPHLRVIQRGSGDEVCADALPIRSFERNKPRHYSMSTQDVPKSNDSAHSPVLYVVSPKDVVVARTRTWKIISHGR